MSFRKFLGKVLNVKGELPSSSELFRGAKKGIGNVLSRSEAGEEVKERAAIKWLKERALYIFSGLGFIVALVIYIKSKRSKNKSRRR